MAVLVTGGSGFVGLNLVERLLMRSADVVALSDRPMPNSATASFDTLPGKLNIVEGDVRDVDAIERAFAVRAIDSVIHAAVITAGGERVRDDAPTVAGVNVMGTVAMLEAAVRPRPRRFVYVSSGAVYGEAGYDADILDESAPAPHPDGLYGVTKFAAERTALVYRAVHGLGIVAARLSGVFGRWEYATGLRDTLSPPLQLMRFAFGAKEAVLPRRDTKDWIYGPDVADGLIALLDADRLNHDLYNVSRDGTWGMDDWCRRLSQAVPGFRYRYAKDGEAANVDLHGDRDRAPLSTARLAEDTGFRARFSVDEAFDDYIEWTRVHDLWK